MTHKWMKAPRSMFLTFICRACGAASMVKHTGECAAKEGSDE